MRLRSIALLSIAVTATYAAAVSSPQIRLTPPELEAMPAHEAGTGTSGVAGIRTTFIVGDPSKVGPYTIRLSVPPNTKIQAHSHRDERSAVVVSGHWYFGYGATTDRTTEKELAAGSFYTEPGGVAHFAETKADPVVIFISGYGPSDTVYSQ